MLYNTETITTYVAVIKPDLPDAATPCGYTLIPYCWNVIAAKRTIPQMCWIKEIILEK